MFLKTNRYKHFKSSISNNFLYLHRMKFPLYISSLYLVLLTIMPCIDNHENDKCNILAQSQNHKNDHSTNTNHCSPFCTCQCCTSPVIYQNFTINFKMNYALVFNYIENITNFKSNLYTSIWQPPKLI